LEQNDIPIVYSESMYTTNIEIDEKNTLSKVNISRPVITEEENGTILVKLFTDENGNYYIVGADDVTLNIIEQRSKKSGAYPMLPNENIIAEAMIAASNISLNDDFSIKDSGIGMSESVPSVWTRGCTIAVRVTLTNFGSSSAYLTVTFEGWDKYLFTWYKEFSTSRNVIVPPYSYRTVWLYPTVPYKSVGLKKAIVKTTGDAYIVHDLGYNFVQKYNEGEMNLDDIDPPQYIDDSQYYYELSDRFHYTKWNIRKEAGYACDGSTDPFNTGYYIYLYVNDKMDYVDNSNTGGFKTDSDEWIINNGYIGVCDEFATLLASFTKAISVPARIIHLSVDNAPSHALIEFWDRYHWIHADASHGRFNYPSYYRARGWIISHVYIVYGADDSASTWDGPTGDGILYSCPRYIDGVFQSFGDILEWETYKNNPYQ